MEIQQNWDRTELEHFLGYDNWRPSKAMAVLSGHTYDYNVTNQQNNPFKMPPMDEERAITLPPMNAEYEIFGFNALDMEDFNHAVNTDHGDYTGALRWLLRLHRNYDNLCEKWNSTEFLEAKYPPEFFIDWAISRRSPPAWLDWAIDKGLYTPKELRNLSATILNTPAAPEFDKASPTYPPELAYALAAWRAVSTTEGKGKPKARIKAWLDTNTTLSEKAKDRIAVVCNWEKLGGATTTE